MCGSGTEQGRRRTSVQHHSTVAKWVERFGAGGVDGLRDRLQACFIAKPSDAYHVRGRRGFATPALHGKQIAVEVGVSPATVSRILRRLGLNRLSALEPAEPVRRYEREHPGELIHIDIKKLGKFKRIGHRISGDRTGPNKSRGVGWEFVHVCIDDVSRIAFSRVMKDERKASAVAFLKATVTYYAEPGCHDRACHDRQRVLLSFQGLCQGVQKLRLKHLRTKPYTPKTNGKAERFIQTSLREWAYARAYNTSNERAAELPKWLHRYNWHRPHGGIKNQTRISRLGLEPGTTC